MITAPKAMRSTIRFGGLRPENMGVGLVSLELRVGALFCPSRGWARTEPTIDEQGKVKHSRLTLVSEGSLPCLY